jgi:integrase
LRTAAYIKAIEVKNNIGCANLDNITSISAGYGDIAFKDITARFAYINRECCGFRLLDNSLGERCAGATLSPEQARIFLDTVAGERLEALYTAALAVGLRMGEALGLRWDDIDLERRLLTVNRILERIGRGTKSTLQLVEPKTASSRRTVNLCRPLQPRHCGHIASASLRSGLRRGQDGAWGPCIPVQRRHAA